MLASDHRGFVGVWPLRLSFCAAAAASRPSILCGGEAVFCSFAFLAVAAEREHRILAPKAQTKVHRGGKWTCQSPGQRVQIKSDYSDSLVGFVGCGDLKIKTAQVTMQSVHLQTLRYWHLAGSIHSFLDNPIPIK